MLRSDIAAFHMRRQFSAARVHPRQKCRMPRMSVFTALAWMAGTRFWSVCELRAAVAVASNVACTAHACGRGRQRTWCLVRGCAHECEAWWVAAGNSSVEARQSSATIEVGWTSRQDVRPFAWEGVGCALRGHRLSRQRALVQSRAQRGGSAHDVSSRSWVGLESRRLHPANMPDRHPQSWCPSSSRRRLAGVALACEASVAHRLTSNVA